MIVDAVIPKSEADRRALWDIRENFEAILPENEPAYLYDVSLPIKDMHDYIDKVLIGLERKWPQGVCYVLGHVADGNLHLFLKPGEMGALHADGDAIVYPPLQEVRGSVSAEHGIGTEKVNWLDSSRSKEDVAMMQLLKNTLDPENLLNPGRVLNG